MHHHPFPEIHMLILNFFNKRGEEVLHLFLERVKLRKLGIFVFANNVFEFRPWHFFTLLVKKGTTTLADLSNVAYKSGFATLWIDTDHVAFIAINALRCSFDWFKHQQQLSKIYQISTYMLTRKTKQCFFWSQKKEWDFHEQGSINNKLINRRVYSQFIIPMIKNQTDHTSNFLFTLSKIMTQQQSVAINVNFAPLQRSLDLPRHLPDHSYSIVPCFNSDAFHFTPAFVLPTDQKLFKENLDFQRLKFEERIQNSCEKTIYHNRPRSIPPTTHCQLCKNNYTDYQTHVRQKKHLSLVAASPANQFISELINKFQKKKRNCSAIERKNKGIQKKEKTERKKTSKIGNTNIKEGSNTQSKTASKTNFANHSLMAVL